MSLFPLSPILWRTCEWLHGDVLAASRHRSGGFTVLGFDRFQSAGYQWYVGTVRPDEPTRMFSNLYPTLTDALAVYVKHVAEAGEATGVAGGVPPVQVDVLPGLA
jgi:hypothetical protein